MRALMRIRVLKRELAIRPLVYQFVDPEVQVFPFAVIGGVRQEFAIGRNSRVGGERISVKDLREHFLFRPKNPERNACQYRDENQHRSSYSEARGASSFVYRVEPVKLDSCVGSGELPVN